MEAELQKKRKSKEKGKQIPGKRNPLQDFNGICRTNSKNKSKSSTISSFASTSSTVSVEAPKGCLHFLLSANNSSSSSSRTPLCKKPKSFTKFTRNNSTPKTAPNLTRPRSRKPSKENDLPRPISTKPQKNQTFLHQWQNGKKPMSRIAQRSNLSSDLASGSEEFDENLKNLKQKKEAKIVSGESIELFRVGNNVNSVENLTPVNKLACGSGLNCAIFDDKHVGEDSNGNSNNAVKTPPVEASVSPEIQCGSSALLISGATPVCYGAGHVLSGVTDKRKCRPRGILTVGGIVDSSLGSAKDEICDDGNHKNDGNINERLKESRPSLIPLPAEASMRWLLSPCAEDGKGQKVDSANKYRKLVGSTEVDDLASSPSMCCGSASDLVCDSGDCNASCVPDMPTNSGKTRIVLLSPRRFPEFEGFSGLSSEKFNGKFQFDSPRTTPSCRAIRSQDKSKFRNTLVEEISPLSIGSLSGGNVIQTPKSDSSSDKNVGTSWLKVNDYQRRKFKSELDSVAEILRGASLSPRSQISMWDPLGLSSQFTNLSSPSYSVDLPQIQKNSDNLNSWNSGSSLDNVSQSQMRISWREGLASRIFEMDELDCCRCLSDEDIDVDGCADDQQKSQQGYECKENDPSLDSGLGSPEYVEQEATIFVKREEKLSPHGPGTWAESISTDGGGLAASGDSDWALCYENQLFKI